MMHEQKLRHSDSLWLGRSSTCRVSPALRTKLQNLELYCNNEAHDVVLNPRNQQPFALARCR